jgi:HSP20 family protein
MEVVEMKSLIRLTETLFPEKRMAFSEPRFLGPKIDLKDEKDKVSVKAILPGLKEKELKVTLKNNLLTIAAERKTEKEEEGKNYFRSEKSQSYFQRSFTLPGNLEAGKMKKSFENGNLEIIVPKKAK